MKKGTKRYLLILILSWIITFLSLVINIVSIPAIIFLISLLILSGSIIVWIKDKEKSYFIFSVILILVVISAYMTGLMSNKYQEKDTLTKSKKIIAALEQYKNQNNHYPERLKELTPDYLKRLPKTYFYLMYDRPSNTRYSIEFGRPLIHMFRYDSDSKHWIEFD